MTAPPRRAASLVFLEERAQVEWFRRTRGAAPPVRLIGLTAEALEALQAVGLPHEPASAYSDFHLLALSEGQINRQTNELLREIERFLGRRYPGARMDGPGFLSGQGYYIQFAVALIAARALLVRDAMLACSPERVTVFVGDVDPWFAGDGYGRSPWLEVIEEVCRRRGVQCEVHARPPAVRRSAAEWMSAACGAAGRRLARALQRLARRSRGRGAQGGSLSGLRLLFADSQGYDWHPVLQVLRAADGTACFGIRSSPLDHREWTYAYHPVVRRLAGARARSRLGVRVACVDATEARVLGDLFEAWMRERPTPPSLLVQGLELFPALATHLRAVIPVSLAIARHTDHVAQAVLDAVQPHAVCFFAMPWLAAKRLAFQCRRRGIPVVCYQHGGSYGTHQLAAHGQNESAHADYFLTYGAGICPQAEPILPVRAAYVPVGSARIASWLAPASADVGRRSLRVLWIAEYSTSNTFGMTFLVEDTRRFLIEQEGLRLLAAGRLAVTYRPYPQAFPRDGITRWLKRAGLRSVRTETRWPLERLIRNTDVVLTDTSSGTVWNEVLALGRPLILYCDPRHTPLTERFAADLGRACHWCRSSDEFLTAVRRLAAEGAAFLEELRQLDSQAFVRDYVLARDGPSCVPRALSFLNEVCRHRRPLSEWESTGESAAASRPLAPDAAPLAGREGDEIAGRARGAFSQP